MTRLSMLFTPDGALISASGSTASTRPRIEGLLAYEHREISYNEERPREALAGLPPATYRAQLEARSSSLTGELTG